MNELLTINQDTQTVSARELHSKLNINTRFNDWFPRMCEYGFIEGSDFYPNLSKTLTGGRPQTDYDVTLDMAKQICMIQRTPEGKMCRQYLIDLEKAWNTPEQVFARALKLADEKIDELRHISLDQAHRIEEMRPKEIFADAVSSSSSDILIGDLAKLLRQNGIDVGQKRLFGWLRDNGYLMKTGASKNMPTQRYVEQGLFRVKEQSVMLPDGASRITRTTKVTGKGQVYFVNKFLGGALI